MWTGTRTRVGRRAGLGNARPASPGSHSMTAPTSPRTVELPGPDGHRLAGILDLPEGEVRATALFAHCFTCSSRSHAAARISRALAAQGVAVLRIDFTGLGDSGGDFADTGFGTNVADLLAAASWLADELRPVDLLVGHSLGGAAVIAAAEHLPDVRAVAVIGAPASPEHVAHLVSDLEDVAADEADEPVTIDIGGRPFRLRRSFLDEVRATDQEARIEGLRRPLLVLHSPIDNVVGVDNARRVFDAAVHPKSFVSLDGADHLISDPGDARWIAAMIATWAGRYVGADEEPDSEERSGPGVEDGMVVAELDGERGYAHRATTPTHSWLLDEPAEVGGEDRGPNPYDQLLAALGACTSMTMRMYARRKGWDDVGEMEVRLRHDRVHAADCDECETTSGQVDVIDREVVLPDGLDPERRTALLAIADKCPVHRTLTHEVQIRTTAP